VNFGQADDGEGQPEYGIEIEQDLRAFEKFAGGCRDVIIG
jgi:hypothetical protein